MVQIHVGQPTSHLRRRIALIRKHRFHLPSATTVSALETVTFVSNSSFTITTGANGDTILPSSEKVILEIPGQRQTCCHTGGAMEFDAYGDLWITQGNNGGRAGSNTTNPPEGMDETKKYESDQWGASSTKGLRGNILRIHPDNSTKGYSIPSGNFGEYFAQQTGKSKYLETS